jgi:hypothetical protein
MLGFELQHDLPQVARHLRNARRLGGIPAVVRQHGCACFFALQPLESGARTHHQPLLQEWRQQLPMNFPPNMKDMIPQR